jgi:transposase
MEDIQDMQIGRLDHLGIISGTIKELGIIEAIDTRLQTNRKDMETITPGEAIAGMIINGLGFTSKPLSLTPNFFENKAVEELFRSGVKAEHFNRHKLGKELDKASAYGCDALFYELSNMACKHENIDLRFNSLDTTTLSVTGEYAFDSVRNFEVYYPKDRAEYRAICTTWETKQQTDILFIYIPDMERWMVHERVNKRYSSIYRIDSDSRFYIELSKIASANIDTCNLDAIESILREHGLHQGHTYHRFDDNIIEITHGHSKDLRSDLKQVTQELIVSQDGGIPLMMQSWDGNASDSTIFKERSAELIKEFQKTEFARYIIADSKLYSEANSTNLAQLKYITRIPSSIKEEGMAIFDAISANAWQKIDENNRYYVKEIKHNGIPQRWIVVHSDGAKSRAEKRVAKKIASEYATINKKITKLSKIEFACKHDAISAFDKLINSMEYHDLNASEITVIKHYDKKGKPKVDAVPTYITYCIIGSITLNVAKQTQKEQENSCYVIASNISKDELSHEEVVLRYKQQNVSIENMGFRLFKDKLFFADSLFLKSPQRIMALLMVMTLSLLVYSIAQRKIRNVLKENKETLPNQIGKQTTTPTLRWLFQLLDGINVVKLNIDGVVKKIVHGVTELKKRIISYFSPQVRVIYGIF